MLCGVELEDDRIIAQSVAALAEGMKGVKEDVFEVKTTVSAVQGEVKQIMLRPGQWWDKLVAAAIGAVGAGVIAAILALVLK